MTRNEIRRRALHAAAAVSFTVGLLACGGTVLVDAAKGDGSGGGGGGGAPSEDPSVAAPAPTGAPVEVADAGTDDTDAGDPMVADAAADAAPDASPCGNPGDPGYYDCCAMLEWDASAGCLAWGPPMPPSMEVA